jgi:hypothetical protein
MPKHRLQPVIDVWPWPKGLGFEAASAWWDYVRRQCEQDRLDLLLTTALLSEEICQLLLHHDAALLEAFALSPSLVALLSEIEAPDLGTFTEALLLKHAHNRDTHHDNSTDPAE